MEKVHVVTTCGELYYVYLLLLSLRIILILSSVSVKLVVSSDLRCAMKGQTGKEILYNRKKVCLATKGPTEIGFRTDRL